MRREREREREKSFWNNLLSSDIKKSYVLNLRFEVTLDLKRGLMQLSWSLSESKVFIKFKALSS